MRLTSLLFSLFLLIGFHTSVYADIPAEFTLIIKDHKFSPTILTVPAGKKIKLLVNNQDTTAEEFESYSLNREKVIPGNSTAKIFIGPLAPGKYDFFGDFHPDITKGQIIAQ